MKEKQRFYFQSMVELSLDLDRFPTGRELNIYWNQDTTFTRDIIKDFEKSGVLDHPNFTTYAVSSQGWIEYGSINGNPEIEFFRRHLKQAELSDLDAAELIQVSEMQVRRWKHIGPPKHVNTLMSLVGFLVNKKKSFIDIKRMISFQDSWIMSY